MANELRLLAIHVEEPTPGTYEWVITERRSRNQWSEIDRSTDGRNHYQEAMANGLVSLEQMIDDLNEGPRRSLDRSGVPQQGSKAQSATMQTDAEEAARVSRAKPKNAAYFGFGPIG